MPPFSMTLEAADYLRSQLCEPPAGHELALVTALRQGEMIEGQERIWFEGEHFVIAAHAIGQRPNATRVELFGHSVSVVASTLESLKSRTLDIRRVEDASGEMRSVLLAATPGSAA